jgi:hypothetical protein
MQGGETGRKLRKYVLIIDLISVMWEERMLSY